MYRKRRNQTSTGYKMRSELFLNHLHSSSSSAFRICYSFRTCNSYTTCCKAREMSQAVTFAEISFLCSVSSKGSKGVGIYDTLHKTQYNPYSWGQAQLVKILTNGIIIQMSPALWAGQRRTQHEAGNSTRQGSLCSSESAHQTSRNPTEPSQRQEEQ